MPVRLPTRESLACGRTVLPQALLLLVGVSLAVLLPCPAATASVQSWRVSFGALSEDPGVAEPQLSGVSAGTQVGAQDGPAAGEDAPGVPSGAPPYVSLSIVHPGDPEWAMVSAPDGASLSDIRSPLAPGASQTWRLRVTGDNGSAPLQTPRYLVLIWYLQDVPDEIELSLRAGDNPGLPGIDVKQVVSLTLTQTAPLQHFEFLLTARNRQVGVVCTSPPQVTPSDASALVQWTTDRASSSRVEFGADPSYGQTAGSGALTTDHAVLIPGLAPLTAYHFRVTSDALAPPVVPYVSPDLTFTTEATPLLMLNPRVTDIGERSAIVRWSTRVPATSRVDLGQDQPLGTGQEDTQLVLEHAVALSGLAPRTAYLVRAVSRVPGSSYGESAVLSFGTPPALQVTDGPSVLEGGDNAVVTWSTDQASTSHVEYGPIEGPSYATDDSSLTTEHTVRLWSLAPDTSYWFRVSSTAPGYAPYESQQLTFATHGEPVRFLEEPGATDLGPRSAALRFVTDVSATSVVLFGPKGAPLDDALAVPGARTSHRLDLQGLSPGTVYQYQVYCTAPGRASALTSVRELRTLDLPAVVSQLSIEPAIRQAVVSYVTDVPISTRVEYGPSGSFGQSLSNPESVTYHLVTLTGLEPNTAYSLRVVAAEAGRVPVTVPAPDFHTGEAAVHITGGPEAVGLTATSALIRWTTDEPSDSLVEYGSRSPLQGRAQTHDPATSHQMILSELTPNTLYSYRVTSSSAGLQAAQSAVLSFTTPGVGTAAYVRGFSDLDVANDNSGGILDPLSDGYGATTGLMAGFAVDEARGLAYLARGPVTTEDGRAPGLVGVACLRLSRPLERSVNPAGSAAKATSRFTDTGLMVPAMGAPTLKSAAAIAFDPVADRVYVLAESEAGILVLSAPGGSVGGAPEGGGVGAANSVLVKELLVPNDAGPSGAAIPGTTPWGLTTSTKDGVTTLYLSLGSHAEVWRGASGQWGRLWSSIQLPSLRPGPVGPGAVVASAVDADGNSYWVVSGPQGGVWQYPAGLAGLAQGVVGAPTPDLQGPGRPVLLESDDTLVKREDLDRFSGVTYSQGISGHTLWLSALGSSPGTGPAVLRCRLPEDPSMPGSALDVRLIDAFGAGALAPTDAVLASLRAPQPRDQDGTQYTQPAVLAGDLLPVQAGGDGGRMWANAYVKDSLEGQVVPTGALLEVAVSPTVARPFYLVPPTQEMAGPTSMRLRFVTDLLVTSTVRYSIGGALDNQVAETAATAEHRVTLSGLKPATTYQVQVVAGGQGTVAAATQVLLFSTGAAPLGDGNLNGQVDVGDAVLALRLALGMREPTAQDLALLDVSPVGHPDGKIAMDDVVLVLRAALGLVALG